jgi:hypothetical protein
MNVGEKKAQGRPDAGVFLGPEPLKAEKSLHD